MSNDKHDNDNAERSLVLKEVAWEEMVHFMLNSPMHGAPFCYAVRYGRIYVYPFAYKLEAV